MNPRIKTTVVLGTALLAFGCTDTEKSQTPLAPGASPSATANDDVEFFQGDVIIIRAPNDRDVIVALDAKGSEAPDGVADQVFLLQRSSNLNAGMALSTAGFWLDDASLRFDRRSLQVVHQDFSALLLLSDDKLLYLSDDGRRSLPRRPDQVAAGVSQEIWDGYGLVRSTGEWNMSAAGLEDGAAHGFECGGTRARTSPSPMLSVVAFSTSSRCAAGGEGSSSCSIEVAGGSCSVSCNDGYYACCNVLGGCKCNSTQLRPVS